MRKQTEKGFTLTEAVVVIGVLIVLTGMTLPLMNRVQIQERIVRIKTKLLAVQEALDNYYYDNTSYPTNLYEATFLGPYLAPAPSTSSYDTYVAGEQDALNDDFSLGNFFQYYNDSGTPPRIQVWSLGPNGTNDSVSGGAFGGDDIGICSYGEIQGRKRTRIKLEIIHAALSKYLWNATTGSTLSGTWATDRANMFLQSEFANDGFGRAFLSSAVTTTPMIYSKGPNGTDNTGSSDDITF